MREIAVAGDDSSAEFTSYRRDERVDGRELRSLRTDLVRYLRCDDGPLLGDLDHLPPCEFLPCFWDVGASTTVDRPEQIFRVDGCWEDEYLLFVFFEILAGSVDLVPVVDEKPTYREPSFATAALSNALDTLRRCLLSLFVGTPDGLSSIRACERTEASEQVTLLRQESFEHVIERLSLPSSVFEFALHRGTDSDLLVGGTHFALTWFVSSDGRPGGLTHRRGHLAGTSVGNVCSIRS